MIILFRADSKFFRYFLWLLVPVVLLTGCRSVSSPGDRLTTQLRQHVRYLPENDLNLLLDDARGKKIVFLGEFHNVPALQRVENDFVVGLASNGPVVYAWEMCYSQCPFYEAASLGKPNPLSPQQPIPSQIAAFNATNAAERQILVTAVDVEHTIYHSKEHPRRYLQEMANRSTSASAREALGAYIPRLTETKAFKEVQEYLQEVKRLFQEQAATFSAVDQEEIRFALELFEASNRYQHARQGLIQISGNPEQIRYEYFVKTIERAYQKAQQRNAILAVRIGSQHVGLTYPCEAKYFAIDHPATQGKVMTLHLSPVYDEGGGPGHEAIDLAAAVKPLMQPGHYCYLELPSLRGAARRALKYSQYFPGNRPVCDGILFVKAAKPPGK